MPANLTPEYEKAELRYRQATSDEERLAGLQAMLSAIPKHKGTEKMQADIKRRISQVRHEGQKAALSKGLDPFHIPRSGAGQVVLVGAPNCGKSSLLAATTHAPVKVAEYPFTTVVPQPGMWHQDDVQIELVDTPPLTADHVPTGLTGTIRNADVVCVVVEAGETALEQADMVLGVLGARGLALCSAPRNELQAGNSSRHSGLVVATKADGASPETITALRELYAGSATCIPAESGAQPRNALRSGGGLEVLAVSARTRQGLNEWFRRLWELLAMIRVYSKEPGRPPDLHKPFVMPAGATVADLARQIHRDLPERMKFARLWGHTRFEGQPVHKTEPLRDKDVVEIHE